MGALSNPGPSAVGRHACACGAVVSSRVLVERGGHEHEITLTIQDLHSITPASFLSLSGGVIHALSYQMAYSYHVAVVRPPPAAAGRARHITS